MKRHVARLLPFCSLPLTTLAEFCLMNQTIKWRLGLVNISWQLWPICSIQALLIGLGSSQHTSAILDYAHDLLSVVNGWIINYYALHPAEIQCSDPAPRLLRYQVKWLLSEIFDKFVKLGLLGILWPSGHQGSRYSLCEYKGHLTLSQYLLGSRTFQSEMSFWCMKKIQVSIALYCNNM